VTNRIMITIRSARGPRALVAADTAVCEAIVAMNERLTGLRAALGVFEVGLNRLGKPMRVIGMSRCASVSRPTH